MDVLVKVFDRSGDRRFSNFALFDSSLMYLPAIAIGSKQFRTLQIENSTMTALFDTNPRTDNKIYMIMLKDVRFQRGVGWELFKNLKELMGFKAEKMEIKSLGRSFVENITPELEILMLLDAKVKKIYPNAFQNLTKLWDLEITNSFVKEFKRSMFATPSGLRDINLSGNGIEFLPDDLFSNMPKLEIVKLNNNKISYVSEAVFGIVFDGLWELQIENNPLKCDCSMKWLVIKSRRIVVGQCDSPDDKKGRNISDLRTEDFDYC